MRFVRTTATVTFQTGLHAGRYSVEEFDSHMSVHRHDSIGFGQVMKYPWRRPAPARASFSSTIFFQALTAQIARRAYLAWRLP